MRVLMLNDSLKLYGGSDKMFQSTKNLLEENGHQVMVIGYKRYGLLRSYITRWFSLPDYFKVKRAIKDFKPDVVLFNAIFRALSPSTMIAAKRSGVPTVFRVTDYLLVCPFSYAIADDGSICKGFSMKCLWRCSRVRKELHTIPRFFRTYFHRCIIKKYTDRYIFISRQQQECMKSSMSLDDSRYDMIHNFIDSTEEGDASHDKMNPKQFLFVGRVFKEKGLDVAIMALDRLIRKENISDVSLKIIGTGPYLKKIKKMVSDLGIEKNVLFLGEIPNDKLDEHYRGSAAVLVPSMWMEAFGNVSIEAMKNSTPIIASDMGSFPEYIDHGKNGFMFKLGDHEDLAKYMKMLYDNKRLSVEMGRNGLSKAKSEFNKEIYYIRLMETLHKAADKNITR